jgi:glucose uptake protein GlcU
MIFEKDNSSKKVGEKIGFVFSFLFFTTVLYGIFFLLDKMGTKNYLHFLGFTLIVVIVGKLLRRWLG